jgi:hypothetical protein
VSSQTQRSSYKDLKEVLQASSGCKISCKSENSPAKRNKKMKPNDISAESICVVGLSNKNS